MDASLSDEELIERCRAQSKDWALCFSFLVPRHREALFQYLWRKTHSSHTAEDLTQETFLRAYQKIDLYKTDFKFKTWLYTIATRLSVNHFKKRSPELDNEIAKDISVSDETESPSFDLWHKAKKLNDDQYTALLLKYGQECSIQEISDIMNKSESNVKVLLYRARRELAKHLPQPQRSAKEVNS